MGTGFLGVFQNTADGLYLMGVASLASKQDSPYGYTETFYTPAVKLYAFPLTFNKTWSTAASVSGTYQGSSLAALVQKDTYTVTLDRTGQAMVPYANATFPVLRVRTVMERSFYGVVNSLYTIRTFGFVTECFGSVAQVTSADGESNTEFTTAKEVRRLAQ